MMFSGFFRRVGQTTPKPGRPRRRTLQLSVEALEDRWLPSTIVVNNPSDVLNINPFDTIDQVNMMNPQPPGGISLRDAIFAANNSGPGSLINFKLAPFTVLHPISELPHIAGNGVHLVANSDVELDGNLAGNSNGLVVTGTNCEVYGLNLVDFPKAGILIAATGGQVGNCQLGADFGGSYKPNGIGVYMLQSTGVMLINDVIPHNSGAGIEIHDSAGITITSCPVDGNGGDGILVVGGLPVSAGDFVTEIAASEIDENHGAGIHLIDSSNNHIGLAVKGGFNWIGGEDNDKPTEGNLGDGVRIESSPGSQSTNNAITYNYIGGNRGNGIALIGAGTANNTVVKNRIGMTAQFIVEDKDPILKVLGNKFAGVALVGGANHNRIGGLGLFENVNDGSIATAGDGNLILANGEDGVRLAGLGTTLNTMQGNMIGTDPAGMSALKDGISTGNSGDGVLVELGAANNLIGGIGQTAVQTGEGNLISGNTLNGVHVRGPGTKDNRIQGNLIGTDVSGMNKVPNVEGVVLEQGASHNTVGGAVVGVGAPLGNVISGNKQFGVLIAGKGTTANVVQANEIGTDLAGKNPLGNGADGVFITGSASGNTVGGVVLGAPFPFLPGNLISSNRGNGVEISGQDTTNNHVEGNQIGTDGSGSTDLPNWHNGVLVGPGASMNFIGSSTPGAGNLISGNHESGVVVGADHNFVIHNQIGTTLTGLATVANQLDGIDLLSSNNGVAWNLISGNKGTGLVIAGSQNVVLANKIGTDVTGTKEVGNQQDGVLIKILTGPGGNLIGAPVPGTGNLISGNGWNGLDITGPASAANQIEGNRIGTDAAGQSAVPNHRNGILVNNTTGYTIGGKEPLAGNLISGNHWDGVLITGLNSTGLVLLGNRIGTNAGGTAAVPNLGNGVHLDKGASNNVIGGTGPADGNLISGNALDGVLITVYRSKGNKILGNRIGTDVSGQFALANGHHGVELLQAGGNSVGGDAAGAGNLISGNKHDGVRLDGGASGNLVAGNRIGTDLTGTNAVPNAGNGVDLLAGSAFNTIGGVPTTTTTPGNVISGNLGSGVVLTDAGTSGNQVQGNLIGTTKSGDAPLGNKGDGVDVLNGAAGNLIGGDKFGAGNVMASNGGDGLRLFGGGTSNNHVLGNWIGTDPSGQRALGNAAHGVWIALGAHDNNLGGLAPGDGNVIAYNAKAGVAVGDFIMDATTLHNAILSNSIYSNLGLGIDLGDDGVTANTPGGPHVGPNHFQNFPVIADAQAIGSFTFVRLSLNSVPSKSFLIQLFANATPDPTGHGQGKTLVATVMVTTDMLGNTGIVQVAVPQNLVGQYLTATATDSWGDTSEFGNDVQVARSSAGSVSGLVFGKDAPNLRVSQGKDSGGDLSFSGFTNGDGGASSGPFFFGPGEKPAGNSDDQGGGNAEVRRQQARAGFFKPGSPIDDSISTSQMSGGIGNDRFWASFAEILLKT